MLGTEVIAKIFKSVGIGGAFVFQGGTVAPLFDALVKEGIEYICPRNKQGL